MTPGTYIRLRREAASLSLRDTALLFVMPRFAWEKAALLWPAAMKLIEDAEADRVPLDPAKFAHLCFCFPLDPDIYAGLIAGTPTAPFCHHCGCSWCDPCTDGDRTCAWADDGSTLCTRCASAMAA